jgi:hypothetical protein
MRRVSSLLTVLSLASMLGCHHVCGVCDCDRDNDPCAYYAPGDHAALPAPIGAKSMPSDNLTSSMQKILEK